MTPKEFWEQDNQHGDQKFYVAFCLMESSLSDYAIARDLHYHNKLNWASTAYYYSLVHALRLVCFTALGDFPTRHDNLAKLYTDGNHPRDRGWITQFISNLTNSIQINQINFRREAIVRYFDSDEQTSSTLNNKLEKWGKILDKARECRNDSNYEGLIIAHEHVHKRVTDDFNRLANLFRKICEEILQEVILLFNKFIDKNPRKDYWYSYLNWGDKIEGLHYFEDSLKHRLLGKHRLWHINYLSGNSNPVIDIEGSNAIVNDILGWLSPLRRNNTNNTFAEEVLNNIKLGIFSGKESLMESFRDKIGDLEKCFKGLGSD